LPTLTNQINAHNITINNNNYYGGNGFDDMSRRKHDYSRISGSQSHFPRFQPENSGYMPESKMKDSFTHGSINIDTGIGDDRVVIGPYPKSPKFQPAAPVAANETGSIEGDPRICLLRGVLHVVLAALTATNWVVLAWSD
jgi:hypothetical protein